MDLSDITTLYIIVPPAGVPHAWGLELGAFGMAIREGFPSAGCRLKDAGSRDERLVFSATTEDGLTFEGNASVYARDCVTVKDVTPAEAARFVVWLRAAVVPESGEIWFTSRAAVDEGLDEREWQIPGGADRAGVEAALRGHLADVWEVEVAHARDSAFAEDARRDGREG